MYFVGDRSLSQDALKRKYERCEISLSLSPLSLSLSIHLTPHHWNVKTWQVYRCIGRRKMSLSLSPLSLSIHLTPHHWNVKIVEKGTLHHRMFGDVVKRDTAALGWTLHIDKVKKWKSERGALNHRTFGESHPAVAWKMWNLSLSPLSLSLSLYILRLITGT